MAPKKQSFQDVQEEEEIPSLTKGPITRVQIAKYAGASGDFNPLHVDEKYATEKAGLDSVIAHGMLSMAFLGQAITDWISDPRYLKKLSVQFRGMVKPGDLITCKGNVTRKYIESGTGIVECGVRAENQRGEVVTSGAVIIALPLKG